MNRNKFSLFNISKDKAKQKITNDLNVKNSLYFTESERPRISYFKLILYTRKSRE